MLTRDILRACRSMTMPARPAAEYTKSATALRRRYDRPCETCGAPLRRVFNPAPVLFKGSGFYVTDSRRLRPRSTRKAEKPKEESGVARPASPAPPLERRQRRFQGPRSRRLKPFAALPALAESREADVHRFRAIDRERSGSAGQHRGSHRDAVIVSASRPSLTRLAGEPPAIRRTPRS